MKTNDCQDENKFKRLAVMGGTFDPVHYGHLVAAEAVRVEYNIDRVIFIPAGNPPHKRRQNITGAEHRYRMTRLAVSSNPFFEVSRLEIDRKGMSYTVDTIKELRHLCGSGSDIYFITGADALLDILTWHKIDELLGLCRFVAVTRPGYRNSDLEGQIEKLKDSLHSDICMTEIPSLAISSTDIRNRVREGRPIKYLLPEAVEEYIFETGIYSE